MRNKKKKKKKMIFLAGKKKEKKKRERERERERERFFRAPVYLLRRQTTVCARCFHSFLSSVVERRRGVGGKTWRSRTSCAK